MTTLGTPLAPNATRLLLLGAGELGKEVAIEAQRYGVEVVAVDRYANAPAMQVAHRSHVVRMLDGVELRRVIERERPHFVVPEIEAIHTATLQELEREGVTVIPTAKAARLTMDREGIRKLAAEDLALPTSPYRFAASEPEYRAAIRELGMPCVVKPVMSSSGKGQSLVRKVGDITHAWEYAQQGGRAGAGKVIVEGFVPFDYEITLLTVRHAGTGGEIETSFCAPIGHLQIDGDYRESWQPHAMSAAALEEAQLIAKTITDRLGGRGIFGVELFVKGDEVIFSEVSPRPHDTGMVTLISQDQSQFALHVRAILGLPVPSIRQRGAAASCAILCEGERKAPAFRVDGALDEPDTQLRLFGKPEIAGKRRMGVALALDNDVDAARAKARRVAQAVTMLT
ncbi:MAG TPA: formate-dependent phosphoribosylglycinamide formyltransferase [Candidatus Binatia bacterium]|nr:formate-dependent phosphoribosylglycinamide formyltransferase [Candidatus Binatia bacterium]